MVDRLAVQVSIRAPARGATIDQAMHRSPETFQSAPPHVGRLDEVRRTKPAIVFQSAPPHGGRLNATPAPRELERFNPRPRTGGDRPDNFATSSEV